MRTVPASEFRKNFGAFKEIAQHEPVSVTSNGRESVVLISAELYAALLKAAEKPRLAHGGEVNADFECDLAALSETHKDVLDGLSR